MEITSVIAKWSSAYRDITAQQFGYWMDGWKAIEKQIQDAPKFEVPKYDMFSFWKK